MSLISRQRLSFGLMHGEWLISSGGRAQVKCTEREFEQNRFATQQHRSLMQQMANSAFCLIMPGNSQSSQRLTEAFLTGCIPVFIGPPWHSLPLTQKVRPPCSRAGSRFVAL